MTSATQAEQEVGEFVPPHPGSPKMPRWETGPLPDAPKFTARNWLMLIGPGLVMGGASIGGGEWLMGPAVTARYGGALLWLGTLSILAQVLYNLEISRYTLYTGEPIFTGKFRTLPGPRFWLIAYIILDFGSIFPYLAASAATPVAAVILKRLPVVGDPSSGITLAGTFISDKILLRVLIYACFITGVGALAFGGKVYNMLRVLMSMKIIVVLGFLTFLAIFYSKPATWADILSGFVKFGTVPIQRAEDFNGNGVLDPGEDFDNDGHLDVIEALPPTIDTNGDGKPDQWADINGDGKPDKFRDVDGDGVRDGNNTENIFVSLAQGRGLPTIELGMIGLLAALASVSGAGGLTNTAVSGYTRDQGWGMGSQVGAIPSALGGHNIELSHVGKVFQITQDNVRRFHNWYRHVMRDQLVVWMPACFIGLALPAMLSVQFLRRGTETDGWNTSAMAADGVAKAVGPTLAPYFWFMTLFCGFLVLWPTVSQAADGFFRRWVDVFWTGSARMRELDPHKIKNVYFTVLCIYVIFGLIALTLTDSSMSLIKWATTIYNFALGFSFFHTLAINTVLLPRPLRPNLGIRIGMVLGGLFFTALATVAALEQAGVIKRG